jgi:hypothetical protein
MPIKSRTIEEKIKELASRKAQFESELVTANFELKTLQTAIIKGNADTDLLVAAQIKVNTIQQTITAFDSQLAALDADLISQKKLETKKEILSKIQVLDDEAETVISRFLEYYTDLPNLNFIRFEEMAFMLEKIQVLKSEFGSHIFALVPNVNKLKRLDLPELESELNNLLAELKANGCKMSVLRSYKLFSERVYPTDDEHAFRLPDALMSKWIWDSIRTAKERADEHGRYSPPDLPEKKRGFWGKS